MSPNQLTLDAFKSPFERELNPNNRWVVLAGLIPWDEISTFYLKNVPVRSTGRPGLNPRSVIGSLIIKPSCNLDDRKGVDQIAENIYMKYFLGYTSFIKELPFDASLFVDFRKKLGIDSLNAMNEKIAELRAKFVSPNGIENPKKMTVIHPIRTTFLISLRLKTNAESSLMPQPVLRISRIQWIWACYQMHKRNQST